MDAAADKIRVWREDPRIFVREVFGVTPDPWQDDALAAFPHKPRIAMKACAGPGKTAVLAWLCWNFLVTRPHPRIAATAISGDNLKDNLWAEMAKWQQKDQIGILRDYFTWSAERITANESPETWWMSARTWSRSATPEQQGNTMRGLHEDYVMAVLDESGGIPQAVMATVENIGSSAKEYHIVQAGNPTHLEGPLYRACTVERDLWHVIEITSDPDDPKRTSRVSAQWAREQIQKYGRDNPWVLVNILGRFPPASLNALIGPDEVNAQIGRHLPESAYAFEARVLGVDVADQGDDTSVIFRRQGLATFTPIQMRNVTAEEGGGRVAREWKDWQADACFIDATGGWASGWKAVLRSVGRSPIDVPFAGKANDPQFANKRTEMYFMLCQHLREGMVLPNLPEIVPELTSLTYSFKGDAMILCPKDDIKAKIGRSPDLADALACTFAQPVHVNRRRTLFDMHGLTRNPARAATEYDPYATERL